MKSNELQSVTIEMSVVDDIEAIIELISSAPDALLAVTYDELVSWIANKQSMVGKNNAGQVIAHQGMAYWQESNVVEIRSAFVKPEYRGLGLNTKMKKAMIESAKQSYPEAKIAGFTEAASKSRGVLQRLGFVETAMPEVPEEMFSPCPDICFKKTGADCGCKVYFLKEDQ